MMLSTFTPGIIPLRTHQITAQAEQPDHDREHYHPLGPSISDRSEQEFHARLGHSHDDEEHETVRSQDDRQRFQRAAQDRM